jgi:hypothetical protein
VEVFEGNTADPKTVAGQIRKLRQRFELQQVVVVGDRGMLTSARIREDLETEQGVRWITALKAPAYPGERLIACRNPLLAEERKRKREELLTATEKQLEKIRAATQRKRRPLRGKKEISLAVGKVLGRYKMGKHLQLTIEEDRFDWQRKPASIEREPVLDIGPDETGAAA